MGAEESGWKLPFLSLRVRCDVRWKPHTESKHITDCWIIFIHHDDFFLMAAISVYVMPTRKTPFCATMINLKTLYFLSCFLCLRFQLLGRLTSIIKFREVIINKETTKLDTEWWKFWKLRLYYSLRGKKGILNMFEPLSTFFLDFLFTSLFCLDQFDEDFFLYVRWQKHSS